MTTHPRKCRENSLPYFLVSTVRCTRIIFNLYQNSNKRHKHARKTVEKNNQNEKITSEIEFIHFDTRKGT